MIVWCIFAIQIHAQVITTIAGGGSGHSGYWGEGGLATAAQLPTVATVNVDRVGNIYIGAKERILKVDAITGIITTIAGTGVLGYNGDNIPATAAQLNWAGGVEFDTAGILYIGDAENYRIRKIDPVTGIISTYVGNGTIGSSGDGGPATAASITTGWIHFDRFNNLYMGDKNRLRKISPSGIITTIAGSGMLGATGEGVIATATNINSPHGITTDINGNVYFADPIGAVRKINIATGIITRVAGTGDGVHSPYLGDGTAATNAHFTAIGIAMDRIGNLYIADDNNYRIEQVNMARIIYTLAGNGTSGYSGDGGLATTAQLKLPQSIALDTCGNLYIADFGNNVVRKVTYPKCHYLEFLSQIAITKNELIVFPNPTNEELHIEHVPANTSYQLCNLVGSVVQNGTLKQGNNTIFIMHLPPAMYMLLLTDKEGKRTVHKIVKE